MDKITIKDFSDGIQEAYAPEDFTSSNLSQMKGIVPTNATTFESQWPIQTIGTGTGFNAVCPLESVKGQFLVGIKSDGTVWWVKAPADDALATDAAALTWTELTGTSAVNQGWISSATTPPSITISSNPDYRFITKLPFQVYKYIKTASTTAGDENKIEMDAIADDSTTAPRSIVPGVLIHSRRFYSGAALAFATGVTADNQQALVAYVDPYAASGVGEVKIVTFPNMRRWAGVAPVKSATKTLAISASTRSGSTCTITIPSGHGISVGDHIAVDLTTPNVAFDNSLISSSKVLTSAATTLTYTTPNVGGSTPGGAGVLRWTPATTQVLPFIATNKNIQGKVQAILNRYPFSSVSGWPRNYNTHHPYTWLDANQGLNPGTGFVPRCNVGAMAGNIMLLGDVEWKEDSAVTSINDKILAPSASTALLGSAFSNSVLRDGNTAPHRNSFYYSESDIDMYDPRSILRVGGTDTRIAGMHVIGKNIVSITTAGGENDGVIAYAGNFAQLHPYGTDIAYNPGAMRKNLVKGNVGVVDYLDNGTTGHVTQTCFWADGDGVVFVDKLGGIYYTNGQTCSRIDLFGPTQPRKSTYRDHPAAIGKYVFVWRSGRLMLFTSLSSDDKGAQGCWSELVPPTEVPFVVTNKVAVVNGSGYTATLTLGDTKYSVGETIEVTGVDALLNGTQIVTAVTSTTISFATTGTISTVACSGAVTSNAYLKSMIGSGKNMYMVANGKVMRYALGGVQADRGTVYTSGTRTVLDLTVSTASYGAPENFSKVHWHRVGVGFYTPSTTAVLKSVVVHGAPVLQYDTASNYTVPTISSRAFATPGYQTIVLPSGIGSRQIASATFVFQGHVVLESISFWYTGQTDKRP